MSDAFEAISACPKCRAPLRAAEKAYVCSSCGASWPIVRGVPRFVDSEHYVGSFGYQWRRHRTTQIDNAVQSESEKTFLAKTGLRPEDVKGKRVLDVGVGTGRFSDVIARWGGVPYGVDLSLAVLSARRNLAQYPGAFVAQADLFKLPFKPESFDVVFSIGVLHHTPSTRDAFRAIVPLVKPGGVVAVGLYEDAPRHAASYAYSTRYRRYTVRLSNPVLHFLSYLAIPRRHVLDALAAVFDQEVADHVAVAIPMRDHGDPMWRVLDTFDWYAPTYQWKHDEEEVKRWFQDLGFEDVRRLEDRNMVSIRGRRPAVGPLRAPPPSEEKRTGALAPAPAFLPRTVWLRDLILVAMLAASVVRATTRAFLGILLYKTVTRVVTTAKAVLGIEGDILERGKVSGSGAP